MISGAALAARQRGLATLELMCLIDCSCNYKQLYQYGKLHLYIPSLAKSPKAVPTLALVLSCAHTPITCCAWHKLCMQCAARIYEEGLKISASAPALAMQAWVVNVLIEVYLASKLTLCGGLSTVV